MLAAAYLLWLYQRTAFGTPQAEFTRPRRSRHAPRPGRPFAERRRQRRPRRRRARMPTSTTSSIVEWIAWTPFLIAIVVFGVYPQLMFKVMDPAVTQLVDTWGPAFRNRARARIPPGAGVRMAGARHRLARDRPRAGADRRHQRRAAGRPLDRRQQEVDDGLAGRVRDARRLRPDRHAGGDRRRRAVDVRRALRRRRVLARAQGAVPAGRLRDRAAQPERARGGRLLPGRVLPAAARQRARHGDDGVELATSCRCSSRSSCCRSRPT